MLICEACGAENRDKARFCIGCAKALTGKTPSADKPPEKPAGPVQTCAACQASNPLAATVCKQCRASLVPDWVAAKSEPVVAAPGNGGSRRVLVAGLLLVGLATGAWWWGQGKEAAPPASATAAANPETLSTSPADSLVGGATSTVPEADSSTVAVPPAAVDMTKAERAKKLALERERKKRQEREERLAAAEQQKLLAAQQQEQQRADQAKARAAELAEQQRQAAARVVQTAAPPAPVKTVEQICAASGNFFAREICRVKTCGDPAFFKDPVCVRFRQMEAENLRNLNR